MQFYMYMYMHTKVYTGVYIVYTGIIHETTYRMEHVACDRKPRERVKKKMERDRGDGTEWERKREGEKGRKGKEERRRRKGKNEEK